MHDTPINPGSTHINQLYCALPLVVHTNTVSPFGIKIIELVRSSNMKKITTCNKRSLHTSYQTVERKDLERAKSLPSKLSEDCCGKPLFWFRERYPVKFSKIPHHDGSEVDVNCWLSTATSSEFIYSDDEEDQDLRGLSFLE